MSGELRFDATRFDTFLKTLENMASGQVDARLPISPNHDALDAIAHGINVLIRELGWTSARAREAQEQKAGELETAVARAAARNGAMLRAIPDLMFVLLRDGTYVDYYARDPSLLFVPPEAFIGRTVRDTLPPAVAALMMDAFARVGLSGDPIVVEYELKMDEARFYEARIVQLDAERVLSIVRDVTDSKRALELNRELAGRLIARQEVERHRIARELHDDVSQRVALMNLEIGKIAAAVDSEPLRARVRKLYAQASEIARDVHRMSYELHPSRLRTLGLVAALESLCSDTSTQRNLEVTFTHSSFPPAMDADVSLCLFRIVQEALHNVARHSRAHKAQVSLTCDERHIALQIVDSGVGFDPRQAPHDGLGLVSMRERVAILDGQLAIDAVPGEGTRITVRIPLASQTNAAAS
jgi:signal transduction histidine kinase